jgi:hypothetical protein
VAKFLSDLTLFSLAIFCNEGSHKNANILLIYLAKNSSKLQSIYVKQCKKVISIYTGYTQENGAVSMVNKGKQHHSFVYTLYMYMCCILITNITIMRFWNHYPVVYIIYYSNFCQSKQNTCHMHCLFSLQHVSAVYAGYNQVEVTRS